MLKLRLTQFRLGVNVCAWSLAMAHVALAAVSFTFTNVDFPGAVKGANAATGINNAGQIVGIYDDANGRHGYLRTGSTFKTVDAPSASTTSPSAINDSGQIVGFYFPGCNSCMTRGFFFRAGVFTDIIHPAAGTGGVTEPTGINNAGQIVGWYTSPVNYHGFLLSGGVFTTIDFPGAAKTFVFGINNSGQIVGWYENSDSTQHGFLLSNGAFTAINFPAARLTRPSSINDSGQIVGSYTDTVSPYSHGFFFSSGTFTSVDFPGAFNNEAAGINNAGQIVGDYSGGTHGFLAQLSTASLTITTPPNLPAGSAGVSYSQTLAASGGSTPYSWSLISGALPSGLTLSNSGVISGTPASTGTSTFTVKVTDNASASTTQTFTLVISPQSGLTILTPSPLPNAAVGVAYSQGLTATGGVTPYKGWAVANGSVLPQGLSLTQGVLSGTGLLSGTPAAGGNFLFTIQVTDNANTIVTKQFNLTITGGPMTLPQNGIVNAASYAAESVAPGEIVTLYGSFPGPTSVVTLQLDSRGNVASNLGGMQVLFDGVSAPMIYALAGQASAIVPYRVNGKTSTQIQVSYSGQLSNSVTMPVAAVVPGIFTIDASGHGQGAIVNQDGTVNSISNPASVGSIVFLYATGEGQTNPAGVDGQPDAVPLPQPVAQPVAATVGGVNAKVLYAGGVSGLVAGVLQANVEIPQGVTPGNSVPIVLSIGGKGTQTNVTLAVGAGSSSQTFAARSVSSTSPPALTPLYIATTGVNPSAPLAVQFSNASGFTITEQPLSIASDGTVTVAVPLYIDPVTKVTASGSVSVVLKQGNQSTAPLNITIQDLPSVISYGTKLGEISHAFFVYEAMLISRRINEFQAYQSAPGNKVATAQTQESLKSLLDGVIRARQDIDYVSANPNLVIDGGTLSNGFPLRFDQNALELMDRIIGLHLSQIPSVALSTKLNSKAITSSNETAHAGIDYSSIDYSSIAKNDGRYSGIADLINVATNLTSLAQANASYYSKDATAIDKGLALASGFGSLYNNLTLGAAATGPTRLFGTVYGATLSGAILLNNLVMESSDLAVLYVNGSDRAKITQAYDDLSQRVSASRLKLGNVGLDLVDVIGGGSGQGVIASLKFITAAANCYSSSCYSSLFDASLQAGAETSTIFTSDTRGFAFVNGRAQIPFDTGMQTPQNGVQLSISGVMLNTLADQNGNFQLFVPLPGDPFMPAGADLQIIDPVTQDPVYIIDLTTKQSKSSQVIDLSGLTTKAPLQLPNFSVFMNCLKTLSICFDTCNTIWPLIPFEPAFDLNYCLDGCVKAVDACTSAQSGIASLSQPIQRLNLLARVSPPPSAYFSPKDPAILKAGEHIGPTNLNHKDFYTEKLEVPGSRY